MSDMQTIQQKRAAFALKQIEAINGGKIDKELSQFIVGVPTMILTNGIGQTLAFLLAKKKDKMGKVFGMIKEWLEQQMPGQFPKRSDEIAFLKQFNQLSQSDYLEAQHECLRLFEWLKRYARAFCEEK